MGASILYFLKNMFGYFWVHRDGKEFSPIIGFFVDAGPSEVSNQSFIITLVATGLLGLTCYSKLFVA